MKRVNFHKLKKPGPKKFHTDVGRPEFEPTPEDRRLVRSMRRNMVSKEEMCKMIINPATGKEIDWRTLHKHFAKELETAETEASVRVGGALYSLAVGREMELLTVPDTRKGMGPNATKQVVLMPRAPDLGAIVWWEKTRRQFKEGTTTQQLGADGKPVPQQVLIILPANGRDQPAPLAIEHQTSPAGPEIHMPHRGNGKANGDAR